MQLTVDKTEKAVGDSDPEDTDENDQEAKAKALADQEVKTYKISQFDQRGSYTKLPCRS